MQAQDMEYHFICFSQIVNLVTNIHVGEEASQESSAVGMFQASCCQFSSAGLFRLKILGLSVFLI